MYIACISPSGCVQLTCTISLVRVYVLLAAQRVYYSVGFMKVTFRLFILASDYNDQDAACNFPSAGTDHGTLC